MWASKPSFQDSSKKKKKKIPLESGSRFSVFWHPETHLPFKSHPQLHMTWPKKSEYISSIRLCLPQATFLGAQFEVFLMMLCEMPEHWHSSKLEITCCGIQHRQPPFILHKQYHCLKMFRSSAGSMIYRDLCPVSLPRLLALFITGARINANHRFDLSSPRTSVKPRRRRKSRMPGKLSPWPDFQARCAKLLDPVSDPTFGLPVLWLML